MSARKTFPAAEVAAFKAMLPTLQHFARFPGCNRAAVCQRDKVDAAAVEKFIRHEAGAPDLWDQDALEEAAAARGVELPDYRPETRPPLVSAPAPKSLAPNPASLVELRRAGPSSSAFHEAGKQSEGFPAIAGLAAPKVEGKA